MAPKPVIHGHDHQIGGADPIPALDILTDAIRFDFDNVGDWLSISTTTTGPSSQGIYLRADVGAIVNPGILLSTDGILKLDSNHVILGEDAEIDITTTITTLGGNGAFYPRRIDMQLGNTTANPQGSKVAVYDAAGVSVFEVRDDGTVHIKTGGSVVADL